MPTYAAFLRAINLGSRRRFPKDDVKAATEQAGGSAVETYLNTGNVRLTHTARSVGAVQRTLEKAYADQIGFDVPTVVFTTADLADLVRRGEELHAEHAPHGQHYVTLYVDPPSASAVQALAAVRHEGETCVVGGRVAYTLLGGDTSSSRILASRQFKALGQGTARTMKVLRTVSEKWC